MHFGTLAGIQIGSYVANLIVTVLLALAGWRHWALVGGTLTTAAAGTLLTFLFCPWIPGRMRRDAGIRGMITFGGHLTGFNFVNYISRNVDNLLIGKFVGTDALGLYAKAYSILMLPLTQINSPLASVAVPALSRVRNDPERLRSYYRKGLTLATMLGMPLVVFSFVRADEIVHIVSWPPVVRRRHDIPSPRGGGFYRHHEWRRLRLDLCRARQRPQAVSDLPPPRCFSHHCLCDWPAVGGGGRCRARASTRCW